MLPVVPFFAVRFPQFLQKLDYDPSENHTETVKTDSGGKRFASINTRNQNCCCRHKNLSLENQTATEIKCCRKFSHKICPL